MALTFYKKSMWLNKKAIIITKSGADNGTDQGFVVIYYMIIMIDISDQ